MSVANEGWGHGGGRLLQLRQSSSRRQHFKVTVSELYSAQFTVTRECSSAFGVSYELKAHHAPLGRLLKYLLKNFRRFFFLQNYLIKMYFFIVYLFCFHVTNSIYKWFFFSPHLWMIDMIILIIMIASCFQIIQIKYTKDWLATDHGVI